MCVCVYVVVCNKNDCALASYFYMNFPGLCEAFQGFQGMLESFQMMNMNSIFVGVCVYIYTCVWVAL